MDDDWKEWDVVELVSTPQVPGFMISFGDGPSDPEEKPGEIYREQWDQFVELLNPDGTGYNVLLALQENMEARRAEISAELKKWEDREGRLTKLKAHYYLELQATAGMEDPSPIWKGESVANLLERLPDVAASLVDQPITEAFVDFDDNGRLTERPDLEDGWEALAGGILIGFWLEGIVEELLSNCPEPRRENITVRYRLSNEQLEKAGIDPDNLDSRQAIQMEPSTTWREALLQIEERKQEMSEQTKRLRRTLRALNFRRDVLEKVLYRFETFGSTEKLTKKEADEAAEEELPDIFKRGSKPLVYAEEIQDVYENNWCPAPETMGKLKAQIGPKGESKTTQLQTIIREAGLSACWENGNPESFCSLVVRLVERHYEI